MQTFHLVNQIWSLLCQLFWLHPIVWSIVLLVLLLNFTWIYFGWAMRLKMQIKAEKFSKELQPVAYRVALVNIAIAVPFDFLCNIVYSFFALELPRWDIKEFMLSDRLSRHYVPGNDERLSRWAHIIGREFLDYMDPSEQHIT